MKKSILVLTFSVMIMVNAACQQSADNAVSTITVDSLKKVLATEKVVVLDVRTPEEYAEGHIEGAVNIDFRNPDFSKNIDAIDKSKKYEVYCHSGKRSMAAVKIMNAKNLNATNVEGGIVEWQGKGNPTVK